MKTKVKEIKDNNFQLPLIIGMYLLLDIIVLFGLCLIELNGVSHSIVLLISLILEFLFTIFVVWKGNIKSAVIFYILLLVTPVFLNLIAMGMHYITNAIPFTPTILLLFRSGYDLKANLLNEITRIVIFFRIPALIALLISTIIYLVKKDK